MMSERWGNTRQGLISASIPRGMQMCASMVGDASKFAGGCGSGWRRLERERENLEREDEKKK